MSLEPAAHRTTVSAVARSSRLHGYVALALILAFIGVGIWWRESGEPTSGGLAILAAAVLVVGMLALVLRRG
jgi:uncharacterized membrane protein